jgi:hypothetical protein
MQRAATKITLILGPAIQFEDCIDCIKVIYPQYDFTFVLSHSQGHVKKLTGGLDAYNMNKGYGGVQPLMHESKIKEHDCFLGMHPRTLEVGDLQSFVFTSEDDGPFWMTQQQKQVNQNNRVLPPPPGIPRMRNMTIAELKSKLQPFNILNE